MPSWVSIGPSGRSTEQATHNTHSLESGTDCSKNPSGQLQWLSFFRRALPMLPALITHPVVDTISVKVLCLKKTNLYSLGEAEYQ